MDPLDSARCREGVGVTGTEGKRSHYLAREEPGREDSPSPRLKPYGRVKDLVDLALLIGSGDLNEARLLGALQLTFDRRKVYGLPSVLSPPAEWQVSFAAVAREDVVPTDLTLVFAQVREYLQSVFLKSPQ